MTRFACALMCIAAMSSAATPREALLAAKHTASEANFRNDQAGMHAAIADLDRLAPDPTVGAQALYWAAWTEWLLSASEAVGGDPAKAMATIESSARHIRRALELRPDDADNHAMLTWSLVAITSIDATRWKELAPEVSAHRRRALELGLRNPRVVMMDAGLIFYTPPQAGGSQEKGIARWLEALDLLAHETIADPTQPDWGRTLADGWLANLYLAMTPPHGTEARAAAEKALAERPDFWFVTTQVLPKIPK